MVTEDGAEMRGRGTFVRGDQNVVAVGPDVPGPTQIAESCAVGPAHQSGHVAGVPTHRVARLADDQWDLVADRPDPAVPAFAARAWLAWIAVPGSHQLPSRVGDRVLQPACEVIAPSHAPNQNRLP